MPTEEHAQIGSPGMTTWGTADAANWLRPPRATDHKMTRGVLGARIGSVRYPGAAVLGVTAAWRTGLGMVRYIPPIDDRQPEFGLPTPAAAVLAARPETVFGEGDCDAWLFGSGTDPGLRSDAETAAIEALHAGDTPLVLDAGALGSVLARPRTAAPAVLTPHLGEFRRLWAAADLGPLPEERPHSAGSGPLRPETIARLSAHISATILLKGSITTVVSPGGRVISVGPATPWLSTAGTGDVLAGILGALIARHAEPVRANPELLAELAATAALVHDTAARHASRDDATDRANCTGAPITALDVAHAVPAAIGRLSTSDQI